MYKKQASFGETVFTFWCAVTVSRAIMDFKGCYFFLFGKGTLLPPFGISEDTHNTKTVLSGRHLHGSVMVSLVPTEIYLNSVLKKYFCWLVTFPPLHMKGKYYYFTPLPFWKPPNWLHIVSHLQAWRWTQNCRAHYADLLSTPLTQAKEVCPRRDVVHVVDFGFDLFWSHKTSISTSLYFLLWILQVKV